VLGILWASFGAIEHIETIQTSLGVLIYLGVVVTAMCFWCLVHIYGTDPENLELCVATKCCTACEYIDSNSCLLDDITNRIRELGTDAISRFRRVYSGSYEKRFLRKL
jgi:hypothetical protein